MKRFKVKRKFKSNKKLKKSFKRLKGIDTFLGERTMERKFVLPTQIAANITNPGGATAPYYFRQGIQNTFDCINNLPGNQDWVTMVGIYEYVKITGISVKLKSIINFNALGAAIVGAVILSYPTISISCDLNQYNLGLPVANWKYQGNNLEFQTNSTSAIGAKRYWGLPSIQSLNPGGIALMYGQFWIAGLALNNLMLAGQAPPVWLNLGMDKLMQLSAVPTGPILLDVVDCEVTVYTKWAKRI